MIWVGALISLAVFLQSLEMLKLKPYAWNIVRAEMPLLLRPFLKFYAALVWLRLAAALVAPLFPHWGLALILFLTTWLIAVRWRGTFNGGSDSMTLHILAAWCVGLMFPDNELVTRGCLYYIAVQITLSYFAAGIAKIRNPEWRNGEAPIRFLPKGARHLFCATGSRKKGAGHLLAWAVILFECLFPLALLSPGVCFGFVVAGIGFHLLNSYYLGLNRFFFAWLAAYPALFLTSILL